MAAAKSKRSVEVGERFGRLTVVRTWREGGRRKVHAACDCGGYKVCRDDALRSGATRSCGCLWQETLSSYQQSRVTHGHTAGPRGPNDRQFKTWTYRAWQAMKSRCNRPSDTAYKSYGAKGVRVCERWNGSFEAFLEDMGERPEGTSIDRIDPYGDYEPENCRWATRQEQDFNRRDSLPQATINGVTKPLMVWGREYGINYATITHRFKRGIRGENLLAPPNSLGYRLPVDPLTTQ